MFCTTLVRHRNFQVSSAAGSVVSFDQSEKRLQTVMATSQEVASNC